jgi:mono/diheme cytochrome c family protein
MHRTTRLTASISCLLLLPVLAAACATAPAAVPTEVPPTPTALQLPAAAPAAAATSAPALPAPTAAAGEITGASLYELSCSACHGVDLKGSDFEQDGQKLSVPALTWEDLKTTYLTDPSRGTVEQQLALSITKGVDETGGDLNVMMPRWSALTQAQVDSLVQYLQSPGSTGGAAPTMMPAAMELTGAQLYVAACAACHGDDAAGKSFEKDGNKITTLSLHWGELTQTYSADPSRGTIADQVALGITKGQDEKGGDLNAMMPRWTLLSKAQVDSLVQYLQSTFP